MVFNLDKCIGCHTCSISCKNIWTDRKRRRIHVVEQRRDQAGRRLSRRSGRTRKRSRAAGSSTAASSGFGPSGKGRRSSTCSSSPTCRSWRITTSRSTSTTATSTEPGKGPISRWPRHSPRSPAGRSRRSRAVPTGTTISPARSSTPRRTSTWKRARSSRITARMFMHYLPRICNHCLNPACVASCPSRAIYKRGEDGVVLVDQDVCKGWRFCTSACPYKKVYFNWESGKAEKCIFCFPRTETGQCNACAHSCVGRIRHVGVLLYDAERVEAGAAQARRPAGGCPPRRDPRSSRLRGPGGGPEERRLRSVAGGGREIAGVRPGQGVRRGTAAPPRVPDHADGVLHSRRSPRSSPRWGDSHELVEHGLFPEAGNVAGAARVTWQASSPAATGRSWRRCWRS